MLDKPIFCFCFFTYILRNWQDLLGEPTRCKAIVLNQSADVIITLMEYMQMIMAKLEVLCSHMELT